MRHTLAKLVPLIIVMSTLLIERAPRSATAQQRNRGLDQLLLREATQSAAQSSERGWWVYLLLFGLLLLGVVGWRAYQLWAADYAARDEQQRTARARSAARHAQARIIEPASKSDEDVLRELLNLQDEEVKR